MDGKHNHLGARSKLTPEVIRTIAAAVSKGLPIMRAAALADVHPTTAMEWIRRGEGRDGRREKSDLCAEFSEAVQKAQAEHQRSMLAIITEAAQGNDERAPQWTAAAWQLEREYPDEYGMRPRMDISIKLQAVTASVSAEFNLSPDQILNEARKLVLEAQAAPQPQLPASQQTIDITDE